MQIDRPRWSYLFFPHLFTIAVITYLATTNHLRLEILKQPGADKLGHFVLYGTLAFFSVGYFGRARWMRIATVLAIFATLEEASQSFFPYRTFDLGDLAATLLGVLLFARLAAGGLTENKRSFFYGRRDGQGATER